MCIGKDCKNPQILFSYSFLFLKLAVLYRGTSQEYKTISSHHMVMIIFSLFYFTLLYFAVYVTIFFFSSKTLIFLLLPSSHIYLDFFNKKIKQYIDIKEVKPSTSSTTSGEKEPLKNENPSQLIGKEREREKNKNCVLRGSESERVCKTRRSKLIAQSVVNGA